MLLSVKPELTRVKSTPVKVRVVEETPPLIEPEVKKPPPKKEPEPPSSRKAPKSAEPPPPPVLGVSEAATSDKGTVAVPLGNTLMAEDKGIRLDKEPAPLTGDMSSPAELIKSSVAVPEYTEQALDASLEGTFVVEVYVDAKGGVTDADLKKPIGFGMDQRVLSVARSVKFVPRKNRYGQPEPGWTEIKFRLQIP
jgi:TonB family protein